MAAPNETSLARHGGDALSAAMRSLFGDIRSRFISAQAPATELLSVPLGRLRVTRVTSSPTMHTGARIAPRSFDVDSVKLLYQHSGRMRFSQGGATAVLTPQHWAIYDPTRPYAVLNASDVRQFILQIPRAALPRRLLAQLDRPIVFDGSKAGLPRVLATMLASAAEEAGTLDELSRTRLGGAMAPIASDLIETQLRTRSGEPENMRLVLLRERVKAFLEQNVHRVALSIDEIAARMGCTKRYIHKAFESEETTLERLIWNTRLDCARDRLLRRSKSDTISEIAFACGFSSDAHFSRAFKARYGITPSAMSKAQS